ncbi:type II toxin-antitoxin system Phd/YefM family antitoxin [Demequina sp.]|uniref:type II toxin-antitoxin system Phd/YefM family antitoxin n=1 Tax=Demequina sp. TaxID=2050685 RepID=UPI003D11F01A
MTTVSASDARQTLPAQLDRVERGEEVAITRHGRVVAVLVRPDVLRARRASDVWDQADRVGSRLEAALAESLTTAAIGPGRAEVLVEAARDARRRG